MLRTLLCALPRALMMVCSVPALTLSLCLGVAQPSLAQTQLTTSVPLSPYPPNISFGAAGPMVMLAASRDHTLFSPIYTDYEDLDGDGKDDDVYKRNFRYYGYFDADKCYAYNASPGRGRLARFEPVAMPAKVVIEATKTTPKIEYLSCKSSTGRWSGNFLNWATMTRIDVVRKTFYGGYRREDTADTTTLEMAQMSQDSHAFVKYYSGSDIDEFTPFSLAGDLGGKGLTLCSRASTREAFGPDSFPLIRMAKGNVSLWGTTPARVCSWADEDNYQFGKKAQLFYAKYGPSRGALVDGKVPPTAHVTSVPSRELDGARYGASDARIGPELAVRVQACKDGLVGSERCRAYINSASADDRKVSLKPIGLLQEFATTSAPEQAALAEFGLITGSYDSNLRGGVLRKNVGSVNDEVDSRTGRFCHNITDRANTSCPAVSGDGDGPPPGIIVSLDRIRLYSAGNYNRAVPDNVPRPNNPPNFFFLRPQDLLNGDHASWGNPISEMVVQALAYFAGDTSLGMPANEGWKRDKEVGLPVPQAGGGRVVAVDPLNDAQSKDPLTQRPRSSLYGKGICRPLNVLAISSGTPSFDTDDSGSNNDVYDSVVNFFSANAAQATTLTSLTNRVGDVEGITTTGRSVGSSSADFGFDCEAKTIGGLASVAGVCPEGPGIKGSYLGAGAAFAANTRAIRELGNRTADTTTVNSVLTADTGANVRRDKLPQHALRVKSYAASLAGGVPRIEVPIGNSGKRVYITPESSWRHDGYSVDQVMPGAVLTFKALDVGRDDAKDEAFGSYIVTWNDAQFGGDYDMDLIGFIRWETKPVAGQSGQYELTVMTDVLGHEAGAQGSHGYSIIGTQPQESGSKYQKDGRYLTHGTNGYASSSLCKDRAVPLREAEFRLLCGFTDAGMSDGEGGFDGYTWAATPGSESPKFRGKSVVFADQLSQGDYLTTTVTQTFLVKDGAASVTLRDPLWYIAKYGSFDTAEPRSVFSVSTDAAPTKPSDWDAQPNSGVTCVGNQCGDGEPDGYFLARRPEVLELRLRQLFSSLTAASNSAPAVSSSQLQSDSLKFLASFSRDVFSGDVQAFGLLGNGQFSKQPAWQASRKLQAAVGTRNIVTAVDGAGVAFQLSSGVSDSEKALLRALLGLAATADPDAKQIALGQQLVTYVRGENTVTATQFRKRGDDGILGPVVNSTPWLQDSQSAGRYNDANFPSQPSYRAFALDKFAQKTSTITDANGESKPVSQAVQPNVLWVGSFDGMLHGFNATTGDPLLSFVPGPLLKKLPAAMASTTADPTPLMDGSPYTADVLVPGAAATTGTAGNEWRTYLFSPLGRGGRGMFALDVTRPAGLATASPASIFKWSFTADDDADLGFSLLDPVRSGFSGQASQVVYLNNGRFGVLQPNGYRSQNGRAVLFILNAAGPGSGPWTKVNSSGVGSYVALSTNPSDSDNGLMGVTWADLDNNGTADIAYGTDLKGQLWRFDLRSANAAEWGVSLATTAQASAPANGRTGVPLFVAKDRDGKALPITTAPALTFPTFGGAMVSFGTGRAVESGDFPNTAVAHRFFTVWDRGSYTSTADGVAISDTMFPAPAGNNTGNPLPNLTGTREKAASGATAKATVSTFLRRVAVRESSGEDAGQVFIAQLDDNGEVRRDASGKAVPLGATDVAPRFDPAVNDGWFFEFPSAGSGEALISSPVSRRNFVLFTTVRAQSEAELAQSCGSGPQGSLFVLSPVNGLPIRSILIDGRNVMGIDVNDQKVVLVAEAPDSNALPDDRGGVILKDRAVGSSTNQGVRNAATNLRVQWREIPGLKTR